MDDELTTWDMEPNALAVQFAMENLIERLVECGDGHEGYLIMQEVWHSSSNRELFQLFVFAYAELWGHRTRELESNNGET